MPLQKHGVWGRALPGGVEDLNCLLYTPGPRHLADFAPIKFGLRFNILFTLVECYKRFTAVDACRLEQSLAKKIRLLFFIIYLFHIHFWIISNARGILLKFEKMYQLSALYFHIRNIRSFGAELKISFYTEAFQYILLLVFQTIFFLISDVLSLTTLARYFLFPHNGYSTKWVQ